MPEPLPEIEPVGVVHQSVGSGGHAISAGEGPSHSLAWQQAVPTYRIEDLGQKVNELVGVVNQLVKERNG